MTERIEPAAQGPSFENFLLGLERLSPLESMWWPHRYGDPDAPLVEVDLGFEVDYLPISEGEPQSDAIMPP